MLAILKLLGDQTRLRLLRVLHQGDYTVQDLVEILEIGQSRVSHHLKAMTKAGLLQVEKQGTWHYYRLAPRNAFFERIWPIMIEELNTIASFETDMAGVCRILAMRRQRSQEFFQQHAQEWDAMHQKILALPDYHQRLLDLVPYGQKVVEVGVGTGSLLPSLAARSCQVIGIDHTPAMVETARRATRTAGLDNVDVRLAEMMHLPLQDSSVSVVVINQVLHHAEVPELVLQEICRVLTPGGRLVIADLARHHDDWVRDQLADQWLGFSQKDIIDWLENTGFSLASYAEIGDNNQHKVFLLTADKL